MGLCKKHGNDEDRCEECWRDADLSRKSQTTGCAVRDPFKEVLDDLDEIADKLTREGLNNLAVSALEAHRRLRNQSETIKQLQEKMHNDLNQREQNNKGALNE